MNSYCEINLFDKNWLSLNIDCDNAGKLSYVANDQIVKWPMGLLLMLIMGFGMFGLPHTELFLVINNFAILYYIESVKLWF